MSANHAPWARNGQPPGRNVTEPRKVHHMAAEECCGSGVRRTEPQTRIGRGLGLLDVVARPLLAADKPATAREANPLRGGLPRTLARSDILQRHVADNLRQPSRRTR